jgi:acyl-CoA oxidase
MAALGISGIDTPKSFGGKGLSTIDACACMYELARKDASIATFYLLHHSLGLYTVQKLASDELRDRIMKDCIPLKKVMAWALTEPANGSDASSIETTATKVEGGYQLTGKKRWIGNATFSDYICVWARNLDEGGKIQCFMVSKGQQGLKTMKIERKMALRAVQNADITLDKVFVADQDRLIKATDFATGTKEVLMHSRIFVAWMAAGMAAGACEAAFKYTKERV